jgi:branched-subunit amino acid ABC-type transport system permease component
MNFVIEIAQLCINGILSGAVLAIPAIGFTLMFAVQGFPNFGISGHLAVGAFAGWALNFYGGFSIWLAIPGGLVAAGLIGVATDELIFRRMRSAAPITLAIVSVAVTLFLENALRFGFGNNLRTFQVPLTRDWSLGELRFGAQQLKTVAWSIGIMAALFCVLRFTQLGRAVRATADNKALASVKGIDTEGIARLTVFLGMGLAGASGILLGIDTSIDPQIGFRIMLSVFAAAVVGGLGSIPGAVLGAFVIGIAEEMSQVILPATYKSAVGFALILFFLTFRPSGLLGERR